MKIRKISAYVSVGVMAALILAVAPCGAATPPVVVIPASAGAPDAPEGAVVYEYAEISHDIVCIQESYSSPTLIYTIRYYYNRDEFLCAEARAGVMRPGSKSFSSDIWSLRPGESYKHPLTGKKAPIDELAIAALETVQQNAR